jgi:hypothetical protein
MSRRYNIARSHFDNGQSTHFSSVLTLDIEYAHLSDFVTD